MKSLIPILLSVALTNSQACQDDFAFRPDKQKHLAGELIIGAVSGKVFESQLAAFSVAMIPGILVELRDFKMTKTGHCASAQDLVYDAIGAGLGVTGSHWIVTKSGGQFIIGYNWELK